MVIAPVVLLAACSPELGIKAFNASPEAVITSHVDGDAATTGTPLELRGSGTDPDDGPSDLRSRWYLGSTEVCGSSALADDGLTTCAVVVGGDGTITLEISDPQGALGSARVSLDVSEQQPPTVTILSPQPDDALWSDAPVLLHGQVSDAEDLAETLTVWWEDDASGERVDVAPEPDGSVYASLSLAEGPHVLSLHAEDSLGGSASAAVAVEVMEPNVGPDCEILEPVDGSGGLALASLVVRANDPDHAPNELVAVWESDRDGTLAVGSIESDGMLLLAAPPLTVGAHVISVEVSDPEGGVCRASARYDAWAAPEALILSPLDGTALASGLPWTLEAQVTDGDDAPDALVARWSSSVDGDLGVVVLDAFGRTTLAGPALSAGPHTLLLEAVDPDGLVGSDTITVTIDRGPNAPTVTLTPDPATTTPDLVAVPSGSVDPDGGAVSFGFTWLEDGAVLASYTTSILPGAVTVRDRTYSVEVVPFDGVSYGPAGTAAVRIENSPPSVTGVTLSPSPAYVTDTIRCLVTGFTDADGDADASSFQWSVDGSALGTGATLSGVFAHGDVVRCEATPFDGTDSGVALVASTTIENTRPVGLSVTLTPSPLDTDDLAVATPIGSDADGDVLTWSYTWTVDRVIVGGAGASLDGAWFEYGQAVEVTATPIDAEGAGTPVSSGPVIVVNAAPTAPAVVVTPDDPMETLDELDCEIVTASTDADGDPISYSIGWSVDGVAWRGVVETEVYPGDSIPETETSLGQTWTCTATPTDGLDAGPSASDSVTIGEIVCATTVSIWWDGDRLLSATVDEGAPEPSWLVLSVTSEGAQSADAELDDLEVRDALGATLYTDGFASAAPWDVCESWMADNTIDGTAVALNDWQHFALTTRTFDPLSGVYATLRVNWGEVTNSLDLHLTDSVADCLGVVDHELGVSLQEYHALTGPDVARFRYGGDALVDAPWVEPVPGWHELGVLWVDSCHREDQWDLDGDGDLREFDCDDHDASVFSGAVDPWGDGLDADCDGSDG